MTEAFVYFLLGAVCIAVLGLIRHRFFDFVAQRPEDYASGVPAMDLRTHLNGAIACEGVIYGPTGRVTSRFVGNFDARWDGNTGVMQERFVYDCGDVQERVWTLTIHDDGRIRATAPDVVGDGAGWQSGPTVLLKYRIKLPQEAGGYVMSAVDWMYLAPNGTVVNRSQFRKFGIKFAELVATMRRVEETK